MALHFQPDDDIKKYKYPYCKDLFFNDCGKSGFTVEDGLNSYFKAETLTFTAHENAVSLKHEEIFALLKGAEYERG